MEENYQNGTKKLKKDTRKEQKEVNGNALSVLAL